MKNVLVICLAVLTSSCSKELQEQKDELSVSPPAWLHGSWTNKDEASANKGWRFTSDEILEIDQEGRELSLMTVYLFTAGFTGEELNIEEYKAPGSYLLYINAETFSRTYYFSSISSQEMSWDNAPPLNEPEYYIRSN